jgi:hypothetical protein
VLSSSRLGDDARLAHAPCEQDLAQAVVDLVAAGVIELVALEVDLCAVAGCGRSPQVLGQPLGEVERARPARVVRVEIIDLGLERRIGLGGIVRVLKLED